MSELTEQDVTDLRIAWTGGSKLVIATAERIVAARAEERERWAGEVRALADEWDAPEMHPVGFNMTCWDAARRLRALLPVTESRDGDGR